MERNAGLPSGAMPMGTRMNVPDRIRPSPRHDRYLYIVFATAVYPGNGRRACLVDEGPEQYTVTLCTCGEEKGGGTYE